LNTFSGKKVLISAYACEPHKGSEPGVGWNWVKQIARFHDVWVITRANNRGVIEKELQKFPLPNVQFIYFDLPVYLRFWKRGSRGVFLYHLLWQIGIYFITKRLSQTVSFDLLHHITFGNYRYASFLQFLRIPYVWGPLGGGDTTPGNFLKTLGFRGWIYEKMRMFSISSARWDFFVRRGIKKADLLIARTQETSERLSSLGAENIKLFSETGISSEEIFLKKNYDNKTFKVVSIGALLAFKGYHLSMEAFKKLNDVLPESEYWIIGDGADRPRLQNLTEQLNLKNKVIFLGRIRRDQVLQKMIEADVMIHPSLHDAGPWVILEAMTSGLPVICLDLGGPALQVTEETGFKIAAVSPQQVVKDMAEAMITLAKNPALVKKMGKAGRKRVEEYFSWDKKGEYINRLYSEILEKP